MILIKIINNVCITIILLITAIANATDTNQHEQTSIEAMCEICCNNVNNSRSYKTLNFLSNGDISNLLDLTDETKNRIMSSLPTFTTIFVYYVLCAYLGIIPADGLFYYASKLLLLDILLATANIFKPNMFLDMLSMIYYLYNDLITPVYINTTMLSAFDIDMNISSIAILSALTYSAFYSMSIKTQYRTSLVARILKDNKIEKKGMSDEIFKYNTANKESILYDFIKNNNTIYLYNNEFNPNVQPLFIKICNWISNNQLTSLYVQRKNIRKTVENGLADFPSKKEQDKCLDFLKTNDLILLPENSKELFDVLYVPNQDNNLLFKLEENASKITSNKLFNCLQEKDAVNIEINDIENPDNYKYFILLKGHKNYYILVNGNILKESYILKLMLFFANFSPAKLNLFNYRSYSNSIVFQYENKYKFKRALNTIIKLFKCNQRKTEFYKISEATYTHLADGNT